MKAKTGYLAALGLASILSITACGDSPDEAPANAGSVPESAGVSGAAFVSFLQSLSDTDETSEPLAIPEGFAVPDDETS